MRETCGPGGTTGFTGSKGQKPRQPPGPHASVFGFSQLSHRKPHCLSPLSLHPVIYTWFWKLSFISPLLILIWLLPEISWAPRFILLLFFPVSCCPAADCCFPFHLNSSFSFQIHCAGMFSQYCVVLVLEFSFNLDGHFVCGWMPSEGPDLCSRSLSVCVWPAADW